MRFCPKCGKKGIKGDFCSECYREESGLEFKDIEAIKCVECGNYLVGNKWKQYDSDEKAIAETTLTKIKNPKRIPIEVEPIFDNIVNKPGIKNMIELSIKAEDQEFVLPGIVFVKCCPRCSKKGTQYFEGVLQLRNMTPDLENFVQADLAAAELQGVHIAKQLKKQDKWDLWLTSNKYMRQLGKKLKKNFTGELSENATLHTHDKQRSKDVYRLTVLFKLRPYKAGDIVDYKGGRAKITTIGKRVTGIDVETGKKVFVE